MKKVLERFDSLSQKILECERILLCYSGGCDSTFLLYAIHLVLGNSFMAVISSSVIHPRYVINHAYYHVKRLGVPYQFVDLLEMSDPRFVRNTEDRCYICKTKLFQKACQLTKKFGCAYVVDGTTADDRVELRPGFKANNEWKVRSLLREVQIGKEDVRKLCMRFGFPYEAANNESCLATRIPSGMSIRRSHMRQVETVEDILRTMGVCNPRASVDKHIVSLKIKHEDVLFLKSLNVQNQIKEKLGNMGYGDVCFQWA